MLRGHLAEGNCTEPTQICWRSTPDQGCLLGFCLSQCCVDLNTTALERLFGGARGSLSLELPRMWHSERPNCLFAEVACGSKPIAGIVAMCGPAPAHNIDILAVSTICKAVLCRFRAVAFG